MTPTQEAQKHEVQKLLRDRIEEWQDAYEHLLTCLENMDAGDAADVVSDFVHEVLETQPLTESVDERAAAAIKLIVPRSKPAAAQLHMARVVRLRAGYKGADFNSRLSKALNKAQYLFAASNEWTVGRAQCISLIAVIDGAEQHCDRSLVHSQLELAKHHLQELLPDLEAQEELERHLTRSIKIYKIWDSRRYRKPLKSAQQQVREL